MSLKSLWILFGVKLGDIHIQNFHLGRYIVDDTVGILVLRWGASEAVKYDFTMYIRQYRSPNENFEYGYPHSNAILQVGLKFERCKLSQTLDVIQSEVTLQKQVH